MRSTNQFISHKMKHKLFSIQSLLAVLLCVLMSATLTACGDDDDDEPQFSENLVGSIWKGVNVNTNYPVEVKIESEATCVITVYEPNSTTIYDQARSTYLYSETTGAFSVEYDDWNVRGFIKGNTMTLTSNRYGNFKLSRIK